MAGFIVIDRKIKEWRWWSNGTARSIWLYLLVIANWKDGYMRDGALIPRGSAARSLRTLASESGYSVNTIRYWLKRFESDGAISTYTTHGYTVINILKYCDYQDIKDRIGTPTDTPTETVGDTQTDTDRTIITRKPINNSRTKMPKPSLEEVKSYISEKGYAVDAERFWSYYESNGWRVGKNPMKNWKAAISTWARSGHGKPSGATIRVDTPQWHKDGKYNRQERQEVDEDLVAEIEQMRKEMKGEEND